MINVGSCAEIFPKFLRMVVSYRYNKQKCTHVR